MKKYILALASLALSIGCSESSLWTSPEASSSEIKGSEADAEAGISVAEPVQVAGAFLVCAADSNVSVGDATGMGCRLEDFQGAKLSDYGPKDSDISISDGAAAISVSSITDSSQFWHWHAALSSDNLDLYTVNYLGSERLVEPSTIVQQSHPEIRVRDVVMLSDYENRQIMFASADSYIPGEDDSFNSIASADIICNERAKAQSIAGVFKALLSDSNTDAINHVMVKHPAYNLSGELIASPSQFWTNRHSALIELDTMLGEDDDEVSTGGRGGAKISVWTGTDNRGQLKGAEHCDDWSVNSDNPKGKSGNAASLDKWVDDGPGANCEEAARLYCVSQ